MDFSSTVQILKYTALTLIVFLSSLGATRAQYGFTTISSVPIGYGSDWGNTYTGAAVQLPQWGYGTPYPVTVPPQSIPQNWQLGAYIQNTPNGVLITQTVPGGLADRTGLKSGDLIVSVGGTQVGYVNGRNVDLIYEINRRVDWNGRVRLVVLEAASRQLRNYDLSIGAPASVISSVEGQVTLVGMYGSANNGMLKVEIQNITRPYMQVGNGSQTRQIFGNGPFFYSITYDPQYIYASDRYRVVATVFDANRQIIASTSQDLPVLTAGTRVVQNINVQRPVYSTVSTVNTSYGYYYPDASVVSQNFQMFLGREPSLSESQAWMRQLSSGMSTVADMKAELLASTAFYDRAGNNPDLFVQRMIEIVTRQPARYDQIQTWRAKLNFYGGQRLPVAREFIAANP